MRLWLGVLVTFVFFGLTGCGSNIQSGDVPVENRSTQADQRLRIKKSTQINSYETDLDRKSDGAIVYPGRKYSQPAYSQEESEGRLTLQLDKGYQSGSALVSLLKESESKVKEGQLNVASSLLERALRIEPKNAFVWHKLAGVRYKQKSWKLAESLALKSSLFSGQDVTLQIYNWHLIASARTELGDISGARNATKKAEKIAASEY